MNKNSIQFGKLLAVLDRIESAYLYKNDIKHSTTAFKYWTQYTQRPYSTYNQIWDRIRPAYLSRMKNSYWYESVLAEIWGEMESSPTDERLDMSYLEGFYTQRNLMMTQNRELKTLEETTLVDSEESNETTETNNNIL